MHYFILITTLLIFIATSPRAEEGMLPVSVQKALRVAESEVVKLRQTYEESARKSADRLVIILKKLQENDTKKGDLESALAIKKKIESIQKNELIIFADDKSKLLEETDSLGNKSPTLVLRPEKYVVGTWVRADGRYTFAISADGTMQISWGSKTWKIGDRVDAVGTWELFKKEGYIRLTYCGEYSDVILPLTNSDNKVIDNKSKTETTVSKQQVKD